MAEWDIVHHYVSEDHTHRLKEAISDPKTVSVSVLHPTRAGKGVSVPLALTDAQQLSIEKAHAKGDNGTIRLSKKRMQEWSKDPESGSGWFDLLAPVATALAKPVAGAVGSWLGNKITGKGVDILQKLKAENAPQSEIDAVQQSEIACGKSGNPAAYDFEHNTVGGVPYELESGLGVIPLSEGQIEKMKMAKEAGTGLKVRFDTRGTTAPKVEIAIPIHSEKWKHFIEKMHGKKIVEIELTHDEIKGAGRVTAAMKKKA